MSYEEKEAAEVGGVIMMSTLPAQGIGHISKIGLVFELVFDKLKNDPETLASCTKVSSYWDEILWEKKPDFMFYVVAPLLARVGVLSFQDLLRCRFVSRNWKRAVDDINKYKVGRDDDEDGLMVFKGVTRFNLSFCRKRSPKQFMDSYLCITNKTNDWFANTLANNYYNPFPTRAISYQNYSLPPPNLAAPVDISEMYYTRWINEDYILSKAQESLERAVAFHEILRVFGSEICDLEYSVSRRGGLPELKKPYEYATNYILDILKLGKNLRRLRLKDDATDYAPLIVQCTAAPPPLPMLRHLRLLLTKCGNFANILVTSYAAQLCSLECFDTDLFPQSQEKVHDDEDAYHHYPSSSYVFPHLRSLTLLHSIPHYPEQQHHCSPYQQCFLQKLNSSVTAPRLTTLCVCVASNNDLWDLMTGICKFVPTLVCLDVRAICRNQCKSKTPTTTCQAKERSRVHIGNFGCLTTFTVYSSFLESIADVDLLWLLRKMPAVRTMYIKRSVSMPLLKEEKQARIWCVLPSLQKLDIPSWMDHRNAVVFQTRRDAHYFVLRRSLRRREQEIENNINNNKALNPRNSQIYTNVLKAMRNCSQSTTTTQRNEDKDHVRLREAVVALMLRQGQKITTKSSPAE